MNINRALIHLGIFCLSISAQTSANAAAKDSPFELLSFEDNRLDDFKADASGDISRSEQQAKLGQYSMLWKFQPGATLTLDKAIGFQPHKANSGSAAKSTFVSWIYNPKAISKPLHFAFNQGQETATEFSMNLDFVGWRSIAVPFASDMTGTPNKKMDQLVITAPDTVGQLYFDLMVTSMKVDHRWPTPDYQVPFVNKTITTRANAHWGALNQYDQWLIENSYVKGNGQDVKPLLNKIANRIDKDLLSGQKAYSNKKVLNLLKKSKKITQLKDGKLKPVQMWRQLEIFYKAKLDKAQLKYIEKNTLRLNKLGKHLFELAKAYHLSKNGKSKEKIAARFVELVAHMEEQGFVRGSALGIMHHQGYSMREWSQALFLMRNQLGDLRSSSQQSIAWYTGFGRIFKPTDQIKGFNVDVMNTFLPGMLMSILMLEDDTLQIHYLTQLSQWMSYSMTAVKGLSGGIQTDGSFFHHAQHYVAYGNGGLKGLSPVVYYLSHTPFALSQPAYQRLRNAVLMTRVFSNGLKTPMSLAGRHPEEYTKISLAPFKYLTLMGDKEIAQAYLRLMQLDEKALAKSKIPAEAAPNGSWAMNYSSMAIHRQDEWLATARGFSRYLVGNESYSGANYYGRYMNYGHLEVLPSQQLDSGFNEDGWDWNRWSGTTTIHLPLNLLEASISQVDDFSGVEEMLLSSESYSGANQLKNQSAMFAMKLAGHSKYDSDLTANKSVFFFDNRIVALGSNINNSDAKHATETTLFQQHLATENEPVFLNSEKLTGLNIDKRIESGTSYILDTKGNAYFVPADQSLRLLRQTQQSKENEKKKPTSGNFATALLDHGKGPNNQSYQYSMLIGSTLQQAESFNEQLNSEKPPFSVLKHDKQQHIVFDRDTQTTGFAIFDANTPIQDPWLKAVDTPSMIMSQVLDGSMEMAVTVPDLNFYQGDDPEQITADGKQKEVSIYSRKWAYQNPSPIKATITLSGHWQGQGENYTTVQKDDNTTLLEVTSYAATPVQIKLNKKA